MKKRTNDQVPGPVLTASVRRFLGRPRIARLATISPEGYPHVVPIYFLLDGDDIVFGSDRDERKVKNALRNPKGAVVIGGELDSDEAGYLIQGDLTVEDNMNGRLTRRLARRYESKEEAEEHTAEWGASDTVILRLRPRKVVRVL